MRGRALILTGCLLTLSNASGPSWAGKIIAQQVEIARAASLGSGPTRGVKTVERTTRSWWYTGRKKTTAKVPKKKHIVTQTITPYLEKEAATESSSSTPTATPSSFLPIVDQPDIHLREKEIADPVLRLLPSECLPHLENFYVRYDQMTRRGLAGQSTVIVDGTLSTDEFRAVLIHEALGHFFDLGCLEGSARSGKSTFLDGQDPIYNDDPSVSFYSISWQDSKTQRASTQSEDFVSGYAATDPFEDFAESMIYFVLHRDDFRSRAATNKALAAKFQFIDGVLSPSVRSLATAERQWTGTVPWDATKLSYVWKLQASVTE